ncbi:hypothetical protein Tco_0717770 [Tanacetum coccineum]
MTAVVKGQAQMQDTLRVLRDPTIGIRAGSYNWYQSQVQKIVAAGSRCLDQEDILSGVRIFYDTLTLNRMVNI